MTYHPANDPNFKPYSRDRVYYLAHPVAPDEHYTFDQNLAHVVKLLRLCYEAGVKAIAPYHTHCLALNDANNAMRKYGLETDCRLVAMLDGFILSGHKRSSGMNTEYEVAFNRPSIDIIILIGVSDKEFVETLRAMRAPR